MFLLALKLLLTPVLIVVVTRVSRAYGPRVGGLLTGLPLTSGPVSICLAIEHGAPFAARAATGAIAGTIGVAAFCTAYGHVARKRSWPLALGAGLAAFSLTVSALHSCASTFVRGAVASVLVAVMIVRASWQREEAKEPVAAPKAAPYWDLPLLMIVATGLLASLTFGARIVGPAWSGALSALPVFTAVLAVFTHLRDGSAPASRLLNGVTTGSVGSHAFFLIVGATLAYGAPWLVYSVAVAAALAVNVTASPTAMKVASSAASSGMAFIAKRTLFENER
jgi:hypothetical protein